MVGVVGVVGFFGFADAEADAAAECEGAVSTGVVGGASAVTVALAVASVLADGIAIVSSESAGALWSFK